jgi:aromatic-L-amino-acid decarboxylase
MHTLLNAPEEIRRIGYRVVDLIVEHLSKLPEEPVVRPFPRELADRYSVSSAAPELGASADEILDQFAAEIEPYPFGNGHPRFYGWVNSPPAVMGIFADALAAAMNPSCAGGNHAAIYVERQVMQWFKHMVGLPQDSGGLLVSGGSMAALTALTVARHVKAGFDVRTKGLQDAPARMAVYKSDEGHGCYQKSVELLGIGSENLRTVECDGSLRMIPAALEAAIRRDKDAGVTPMAVVASAGTVNTGAIDPLDEIADICERHGVWFHVDGAYGAPAILTAEYRDQLAGLARCDSLALDPHKWLYVPVEAGLVLVRGAQAMRAAFSLVPPYLRTAGNPSLNQPWLSEFGFQQTRGFRALKVWMTLKHFGLAGYRRAIDHDIELARHLADAVRRTPTLELFEPQNLSVVCFRVAGTNEMNQQVLERVQLGGEAFLSGTTINGQFWLRACVVNHRAERSDIDALLQVVEKAQTLGSQPGS